MTSLPVRTNGSVAAEEAAAGANGIASRAEAPRWRNDSEGGWVVQKFGGTSVGKFAVNIAEDIVRFVLLYFVLVPAEEGDCGGVKAIMRLRTFAQVKRG